MEAERPMRNASLWVRLAAVHEQLDRQSKRLTQVLERCRETRVSRFRPPATPSTRLFATDAVRLGDVDVLLVRQAVREGRTVRRLTPTEWQLLLFLLSNPDTVHNRAELATGAWGAGYHGRDTEVEVYVSRLRRKLGSAGRLLETVRGQGYRLVLWTAEAMADEDVPSAIIA